MACYRAHDTIRSCLALAVLTDCSVPPRGPEPVHSPAQAAQAVLSRNLMGARRDVPAKADTSSDEAAFCSVRSQLAGVIATAHGGGYLVLREGAQAALYAPGQGLPNGATVLAVERGDVIEAVNGYELNSPAAATRSCRKRPQRSAARMAANNAKRRPC